MRKLFLYSVLAAVLSIFVACQKQQTDEEKNAEVERKVQERLAAERQTQQQQQLDQRQAELDAREKALANQQKPAADRPAESSEREQSRRRVESREVSREPRERAINVGYSTFYNKLDRYGDWVETDNYGYVFHPREAESSRSWRTYTNGRWVYTDAGWTWMSEEPFGWATYHYGRWTRLRGIGWVWVPGNQWAPAWVSWRKSSDYVGWAPLPPEARFDQRTGIHNWSDNYYDVGPDQYSFVASREFGAPRVEQTLVPSERNITIINQTTNVTNITYNNTNIVNEGPSYDELRAVSREPVQRYRLERNVNVDLASEPSRGEVRGETIVIVAPVFSAPQASERPPTVKEKIAMAAIDLGWAAISNQEEAKKARQKMKSEATPPPNAPSKKFVKAETTTTATTQSSETASATSTSASATAAPTSTVSASAISTASPTTPSETMTPHRAPTAVTSATAASTAIATATPAPTMMPHRAPTAAPSATAAPISSPAVSPTASQRRGRLLVPTVTASPRASATVSAPPRSAPSVTPQPTAANSPIASDTVPSHAMTPAPERTPLVQTQSPPEPRGKFKSQGQKFQPRKVEPMPSASMTPTGEIGNGRGKRVPPAAPSATDSAAAAPTSATSTSSQNASSTPSATAFEKMTKQEKKEQRREQRQEMKRERRGENEPASPSPTPSP
ncbi:MAG TPA: DUF6600 domain-containing protein [Chthoniobacterales bacterium]|nr:DUF6600 domain-containing protein [Chthoniobacterales bacterium]